MNINEMNLAEIESRSAEIEAQIDSVTSKEELETLSASLLEEKKALEERKVELKDLEERKAIAKEIEEGTIVPNVIEERKEEKTMKTVEEFRNSKEYINAFAEYIKTGDDTECRSLLTTNVGDAGEVAIPDLVSNIIKTDWLQSEIMSKVTKIEVGGNYKQQFELSAGDAVIHNEGSGAVDEESLTLGIVTLIPESIKKWISVSDEVLDLKGEAFLNYIVKEISYRISLKAEDILLDKIVALGTSATSSAVNAKVVKAGAALGTIATALGQLNAEARNPVVVMNPATKAAFKAAVYSGQFNADPFEGLEVVLTNNLPAISAASENDTYAIVGDFGYGALANVPKGNTMQIKIDDKTAMTSDLVKILGREYVAVEPVACRAFVKITKPAAL